MEADNEALGFTEAPETLAGLFRQRFRWTFGTLQCLWKHRDALGRYGWFGCVLLPSLWLFQIVFQALAPLVDLQILWALADAGLSWLSPHHIPQDSHQLFQESNPLYTIGLMYGLFFLVELGCSLVAFRFDCERMRLLWSLFWQRFAYRQLMYLCALSAFAVKTDPEFSPPRREDAKPREGFDVCNRWLHAGLVCFRRRALISLSFSASERAL